MAITQGAPLPNITQTTTRAEVAPDYYTQYLQGLSQAAQTGLARTPEQGVAPMDVLQTQGYGMVPGAATAYQPGLAAAGQTAATAAAGFDPNRIQAFMDPYQRQVVDEMARLQQQNIQRSVLPSMKGAFVGRGDLGSQRYASATGQTLADMQRNLMGQQYGALSSGYQNALKAAMEELDLQNRAAQTQAGIAKAEQELGLTGAGAMTKAGAERQAYEQSLRDFPLKQATAAAGLMRGYQLPTTQTETFVGPKAGLYQTSPLSNILGVLSTLGAIRPGGVTYDAQGRPMASDSLLKGAYDTIRRNLPSFSLPGSGSFSESELQADEAKDEEFWKGLLTSPNYDQYFEGSTLPITDTNPDLYQNVAYKTGGLVAITKK
jgi:hypothetical protein